MGRCTTLLATLLVSVALGEKDALAVEAAAGAGSNPASPTAIAERAEAAYDRSIALYSAGDKTGALAAMQESYRLLGHPDLLYNIARLERELGQCWVALGDYRVYIGLVPTGEYRASALEAERDLNRTCGGAPAEPYWTTRRIIGWSAIGAGAVAGAGAVYFALSARSAHDDAQRAADAIVHAEHPEPWTAADHARELDAQQAQTLAIVSGAAAGGLLTGGVLLLVFPMGREEKAAPDIAIVPQPGGAFVGYSRRF
jgi:tetratricopeptide (TPR) repeat protein